MAATYDFYCERADQAAKAAANATLANVRERELRAEKTWRGLADQARAVAVQREKVEREKAEQREAEAEAAS
ncbi:hypothetical protein AMC99_00402 [Altererythrobacter epoxidivorans]|uniref:Uncharacterized protein n=1 Tax=Altererythrobacter epoxidivorans TaxID=361183 RepID=A0A0M4M624_9SPHN|nr:hypothetical protein [Altererythrobacter epoxidivorans]ALE15714.1 hypothetical protein AMC99_00402 [Altererythrobacter epoxidivorans]